MHAAAHWAVLEATRQRAGLAADRQSREEHVGVARGDDLAQRRDQEPRRHFVAARQAAAVNLNQGLTGAPELAIERRTHGGEATLETAIATQFGT